MSSGSTATKNKRLLSRLRAFISGNSEAEAQAARKQAALAHRVVTQAVRESLATAGFLSSYYRTKVLSTLGSQNRVALVLNVLEGPTLSLEKMGALERQVALLVRTRGGLELIAMYWRWSPFVAEPAPAAVPSAAERKAQAFALAEKRMRENDPAWAETRVDDDYTPPEASNSDLMPLMPLM